MIFLIDIPDSTLAVDLVEVKMCNLYTLEEVDIILS